MNYEIILATTAPSAVNQVLGLEALQEIKIRCINQAFVYMGELFVVVTAKVIRFGVSAPIKDQWALLIELKPFEESTIVDVVCDGCGRETAVAPEDVEIFGVTLKTAFENENFNQAMVELMKRAGVDLHLTALVPEAMRNSGYTG